MTDRLGAVLAYARQGWPVLLVRPGGKLPLFPSAHPTGDPLQGRCHGGCGQVGHGFYDATTDPVAIETWYRRHPQANVGIRTGSAAGIFVLDIDADHGGELSLARLVRRHGALPATLTSRTGGGGRHIFFAWPAIDLRNSASRLGDGIDIRAEGGYIVAPPSRTTKGPYQWLNPGTPTAPAPPWLLTLLRKPPTAITVTVPRSAATRISGDILRDKAAQVRAATPRMRNHTLNAVAYSLGRLVGARILDEAEVIAELTAAALAAGLEEREIAATIRSGLGAGVARPRVAEA